MIVNATQYSHARAELEQLEEWLGRLHAEHPGASKGLTKAGVRKMIARLHEELAVFEGSQELDAAAVN